MKSGLDVNPRNQNPKPNSYIGNSEQCNFTWLCENYDRIAENQFRFSAERSPRGIRKHQGFRISARIPPNQNHSRNAELMDFRRVFCAHFLERTKTNGETLTTQFGPLQVALFPQNKASPYSIPGTWYSKKRRNIRDIDFHSGAS